MLIETARLILQPLGVEHAAGLHAAFGDPAVMRYWNGEPSAHPAETAGRLARASGADPAERAAWAMLRRDDAQVIGMVNYHHRDIQNARLEIGYLLAAAYWRQGYMAEALTGLLDHCFGALDVHRVEAGIEPGNAGSRALLASLGFLCEGGPLRQCVKRGDGFMDMMIYGILAPEWRARRQPANLE